MSTVKMEEKHSNWTDVRVGRISGISRLFHEYEACGPAHRRREREKRKWRP
jgi:hypothetical protein